MIMPKRRFYAIREVAQLLDVSVGHVRNLIDVGSLAAVNVSTNPGIRQHYRIPVESVETFIQKRSDVVKPVTDRRSVIKN